MTRSNRERGSSMMELPPALLVFFFAVLFPLINLMGLAVGTATIAMIGQQTVQAAANASSYGQALNSMQTCAQNMMNTGFAKFAKLKPVQGYNQCGTDLYVLITTIASNKVQSTAANQPISQAIDTTNNLYEYQTRVVYKVVPFINMSGIPLVKNIPGVGSDSEIQWVSTSNVEFPDGLLSSGSGKGQVVGGGKGPEDKAP